MSDPTKADSLADLAKRVHENADTYMRSWRGEELAKLLRDRFMQLQNLSQRTERIATHHRIVLEADPKVRVPKKRLGPRVKNLAKLENVIALDIKKIVEPGAIDVEGLSEALEEAEEALLSAWQKFARPARETSGTDALVDLPELEQTARQLWATREQLEAKSKQLPTSESDVAYVRELQQQMTVLGDQIRTKGYPDEVLAFLSQVRTGRGATLAEVLKNPILRVWLETGRNASALRVVHDSALNPKSPLRP